MMVLGYLWDYEGNLRIVVVAGGGNGFGIVEGRVQGRKFRGV